MFNDSDLVLVREMLSELKARFASLPLHDEEAELDRLRPILLETAKRLAGNPPYHHPLYAGRMLKPPHPIARLAYTLALYVNPDNRALDGGAASSSMEKDAIAELARLFGWETHFGHLTSGPAIANLEALRVARSASHGKAVLASSMAHDTQARACDVLRVPFEAVPIDSIGRMDLDALASRLERGGVGTVVATLGTSAVGAVDPLAEIASMRERFGFRLHVDAGYGGFFTLVEDLDDATRRAHAAIVKADSIVVDPHNHGLQPHGCGCVLFRDPNIARCYLFPSPLVSFSASDLDLGGLNIESSRPGAAAVALWATLRLLPLARDGELACLLAASRRAAVELHTLIASSKRFLPGPPPALDIVVWSARAASASAASARNCAVCAAAAERDLHLTTVQLPHDLLAPHWPELAWDVPTVSCLQSCLIKPEHETWLNAIWNRICAATDEVPIDACSPTRDG
jgi:glutamate/tyrosine decarboxylase-like PLP-dependent enzyme